MAGKIIEHNDSGIVVREVPVKLSDEKLRGMLSCAYEKAQKDMSDKNWYDYYDVAISIAFTLFLTLLVSDFKPICGFTIKEITFGAWVIFVIALGFGVVSAMAMLSHKKSIDTTKRDKAVEEIFKQHCTKD